MSEDSINLLTAMYLNNKVALGIANTTPYTNQISVNSNSIEQNKVILQDIKDAIETKNREYLEHENDINKNGVPKTLTLQDWSLSILYAGIGFFSFLILIHIFTNVQNSFIIAIGYLVLVMILFICGIFIIQRYG